MLPLKEECHSTKNCIFEHIQITYNTSHHYLGDLNGNYMIELGLGADFFLAWSLTKQINIPGRRTLLMKIMSEHDS